MKDLVANFIAVGALALTFTDHLPAQTFSVLHHFGAPPDGRNPQASLVAAGNSLFGVADSGGTWSSGAFFKLNQDGGGYGKIYDFTLLINETNSDGAYPDSTPVLSGNTLYGTAYSGGISGNGTVFKLNTNGTGFTVLHHFTATAANNSGAFTNADGANPESGLLVADNIVYGTTENGGTSGFGAVYRVGVNGTGFTNLHSFTGSDGSVAEALVLAGNQLYGTAAGLNSGIGTVFKLNTNGTGFTILRTFVATNYVAPNDGPGAEPAYTNLDGALPTGLMASGTTLYGTTYWGGIHGNGTVFKMQTDGSGFAVLHHFAPTATNLSGAYTNSGGAHPIQLSGLVLTGKTLYGTTYHGGKSGNGTVFALLTNGSSFTVIHDFSATTGPSSVNADGVNPFNGLLFANNTLFGTTTEGGTSGNGTVFRLLAEPRLSITRSSTNMILTWPVAAIGFTLQSATNLFPAATWSTVTPAPVAVNGLNTVTNPAASTQKFYRLSQ